MTDHLPDCDDYAFSGAGYHPKCERICICRQVRRIEKRVLDAAREAVAAKAMHSPKCFALLPDFDERDCNCAVAYSLAAIDALREEQK